MTYTGIILLLLATILFWVSNRQRKAVGLPGGRIIYTDTRGWGRLEKPLYDNELGLAGKPDYLVKQEDEFIPVEVKSGRTPPTPYDSHIFQLAAYCLLVESNYKQRPAHGILHYPEKDFAVDYTPQLESDLRDLLAEIRQASRRHRVPRSHDVASRCVRCGFSKVCDQKLT